MVIIDELLCILNPNTIMTPGFTAVNWWIWGPDFYDGLRLFEILRTI